ncbi:hypothetical protein [Gayadomonas joobiniege]|uniref:hypothetical protein n=1 Tax=Gayadomonas joobiniege TaxID=1234606 RepID=UPI00036F7F80|nr:hypothetical protein [Gayadomonas joobiniege]
MSKDATEQALEAFIAEAKKAGLDIKKIANNAKFGIKNNEVYTWIATTDKQNALDALDHAIEEVLK